MKDLQELFESLGTDEFNKLSELMDKKSANPQSVKKFFDYISQVYCGEKQLDEAEISAEEMTNLIQSFTTNVAIYTNVIKGHMEIKGGRLKLTDENDCTFCLTPEGIKHVEGMLEQSKKKGGKK